MAIRRRRVRVKRPKRTRRYARKRKTNKIVTVRTGSQPVADRQFVKLNFVDIFQYNLTVTGTLQAMRLYQSSAFSPRQDGNAHQPMWYDQYCPGFFSSYRCYGVAYHVTFQTTNATSDWWVSVRAQNSTTAETSLQALMERADAQTRMGGPVTARSQIVIKGYMSVAKVRGCSKNDVSTEDDYRAAYNANPALMAYLVTYINSNAAQVLDITVRLRYYLELGDRITPGSS